MTQHEVFMYEPPYCRYTRTEIAHVLRINSLHDSVVFGVSCTIMRGWSFCCAYCILTKWRAMVFVFREDKTGGSSPYSGFQHGYRIRGFFKFPPQSQIGGGHGRSSSAASMRQIHGWYVFGTYRTEWLVMRTDLSVPIVSWLVAREQGINSRSPKWCDRYSCVPWTAYEDGHALTLNAGHVSWLPRGSYT